MVYNCIHMHPYLFDISSLKTFSIYFRQSYPHIIFHNDKWFHSSVHPIRMGQWEKFVLKSCIWYCSSLFHPNACEKRHFPVCCCPSCHRHTCVSECLRKFLTFTRKFVAFQIAPYSPSHQVSERDLLLMFIQALFLYIHTNEINSMGFSFLLKLYNLHW